MRFRPVSSFAALAVVLGVVVACQVGPDEAGQLETGALCATNDDCESGFCRVEGFCGEAGCSAKEPCPSGWTCETSRGDPIFGIGGGNTYCEPTCAACPKDTACEDGSRTCTPLAPRVTVTGDVPAHVDRPSNLELAIDARGRTFSEIRWTLAAPLDGAPPTPASGTGTKITTTFQRAGVHQLELVFEAPHAKPTGVKVSVPVCGEPGSECSGGEGECCGGECVVERREVGATSRRSLCASRCPATCAPGWSCRELDRGRRPSAPTGAFCLPDLAQIAIDYSPKTPKLGEPVTFTATVTSPAGLAILGTTWRIDDSGLDAGHGLTLVQAFSKSGPHDVILQASDDAGQFSTAKVSVTACIPAGETCGFTEGKTCCGDAICIGSTCQ